jgi:hypothetical protein
MMTNVEQLVDWELTGETEILGENLPQCYFVLHKSHMTWPGLELGQAWWETGNFLFIYLNIGRWSPFCVHSALRPLLAYCSCPGLLWWWRSWWNERFWQGKPKYSEETCPDATLSTTTRVAAVGNQRLTASAVGRASPATWPSLSVKLGDLRLFRCSSKAANRG